MINRICIIGGPGSGKTTLANKLAMFLKLPVIHIDELYENKNWKFEDREKIEHKLVNIINNTNKWIIDGTYTETLEERLKRCDFMIYLDFSTSKLLRGIFRRRVQNVNISKEKLGWNEKISLSFVKYVLGFNNKKRRKINSILKDNKKCIVLKNRREVEILQKIFENINTDNLIT